MTIKITMSISKATTMGAVIMMMICTFLSPTGIGSMLGLAVVAVVGAMVETGRRIVTTTNGITKVNYF